MQHPTQAVGTADRRNSYSGEWVAYVVAAIGMAATAGFAVAPEICYEPDEFGVYDVGDTQDCTIFGLCPTSIFCRNSPTGNRHPGIITPGVAGVECPTFRDGADTDGDGLCDSGITVRPAIYVATVNIQDCPPGCDPRGTRGPVEPTGSP
ncbi:MAG: hypothetical protein AAGF47_03940 [Planctomycetota bacterium]